MLAFLMCNSITIAFCVLVSAVHACLNISVSGTKIEGDRGQTEVGSFPKVERLEKVMHQKPSDKIAMLEAADANKTNLGVVQILESKYQEAIQTFLEIEQKTPGEYATAANLGTAYELAGDLENALHWIKKSIAINSDAHEGTEWLHVKILEAKIKMKSEPDYWQTHHILDFPFIIPKEKLAFENSLWEGKSAYLVREAMIYQLHERMLFVKPHDPIVADLLYSLSVLVANQHFIEIAQPFLALAKDYAVTPTRDMIDAENYYRSAIMQRKFYRYLYITLGVMLFILLMRFCIKKKWLFLSKKSFHEYQCGK